MISYHCGGNSPRDGGNLFVSSIDISSFPTLPDPDTLCSMAKSDLRSISLSLCDLSCQSHVSSSFFLKLDLPLQCPL